MVLWIQTPENGQMACLHMSWESEWLIAQMKNRQYICATNILALLSLCSLLQYIFPLMQNHRQCERWTTKTSVDYLWWWCRPWMGWEFELCFGWQQTTDSAKWRTSQSSTKCNVTLFIWCADCKLVAFTLICTSTVPLSHDKQSNTDLRLWSAGVRAFVEAIISHYTYSDFVRQTLWIIWKSRVTVHNDELTLG